jgi:hypothetical protein
MNFLAKAPRQLAETSKINARRHTNLVKITVEAKRHLDAAGVSPREVPLKIIHPISLVIDDIQTYGC